ncbi:MAG: hypothetical protein ACRC7N_21345 [Clostridium sp.]
MGKSKYVKDAITKLYDELNYLEEQVEECGYEVINSAISDMKDAVDNVRDEFDDYNSEIDDIKELIEEAYSDLDKVVG